MSPLISESPHLSGGTSHCLTNGGQFAAGRIFYRNFPELAGLGRFREAAGNMRQSRKLQSGTADPREPCGSDGTAAGEGEARRPRPAPVWTAKWDGALFLDAHSPSIRGRCHPEPFRTDDRSNGFPHFRIRRIDSASQSATPIFNFFMILLSKIILYCAAEFVNAFPVKPVQKLPLRSTTEGSFPIRLYISYRISEKFGSIFGRACTCRKYVDPCALGGDTSDRIGVPAKAQAFVEKGEINGAAFSFAKGGTE